MCMCMWVHCRQRSQKRAWQEGRQNKASLSKHDGPQQTICGRAMLVDEHLQVIVQVERFVQQSCDSRLSALQRLSAASGAERTSALGWRTGGSKRCSWPVHNDKQRHQRQDRCQTLPVRSPLLMLLVLAAVKSRLHCYCWTGPWWLGLL